MRRGSLEFTKLGRRQCIGHIDLALASLENSLEVALLCWRQYREESGREPFHLLCDALNVLSELEEAVDRDCRQWENRTFAGPAGRKYM